MIIMVLAFYIFFELFEILALELFAQRNMQHSLKSWNT